MSENFDPEIIARHAAALPRYTSYPTANHFTGEVGPADYRAWLPGLDAAAPISLYLHIPFCQQLCWYCACNTKATRRYEPVTEYLALLDTEIAAVAALLHARPEIAHLHWGGGSPDILNARDILRLGDALRGRFNLRPDAEFAVEVDPRLLKAEQADSFARIGVNRVSIGVQDFDPSVQDAIGRHQGYDVTRAAIDSFRDRGVRSINVDLVYGLPRQTEDSVARTLEQVLTLAPDRIAIFGYAHLPQRMRHQQLIDQNELPGATHRFAQSNRLASILSEAGYVQLGLDHFARGDDPLARKPLARNFQGYTTDSADVLIGLGASAIGKLPQGYVQNATATGEYARRLEQHGLATARGWVLSREDRIRAYVIERLMCDFTFSSGAVATRFGNADRDLQGEAESVIAGDRDGFIERTHDGFRLTPRGRPFVRNICARFDAHLGRGNRPMRHALSV